MAKVTDVKRGEITEVTLVLTGEEARVLLTTLNAVGGLLSGPRGKTEAVRRAIQNAGVIPSAADYDGIIMFTAE